MDLDVRIRSIENTLEKLTAAMGVTTSAKVEKSDIDAYLAVMRAAVAVDWGEFCGINDCFKCIVVCRVCRSCTVCNVCSSCKICFECTGCGPCAICLKGTLASGLKEFEGFNM